MSLRPKVISRVGSLVVRQRATLHASARSHNSDNALYPFTKPSSVSRKALEEEGPKAAYPFTAPSEPTKVATPSRPQDRPGPNNDSSDIISSELNDHSIYGTPDYYAVPDYRTHAFSPVPRRVLDGSEEIGSTTAAVVSGAPTELQARTVRIYKPAKTATQSGDWHSHSWKMDWDILPKGHRWENPLMGWQSSSDFMQGTKLNFKSKEDAIRFAEKQGYEYFVQEPNERRRIPKAYATQFLHTPGKLKTVRTK